MYHFFPNLSILYLEIKKKYEVTFKRRKNTFCNLFLDILFQVNIPFLYGLDFYKKIKMYCCINVLK